ncbi:uncharacterized protein LOC130655465 isoform X2 [Hydractinia symbiolongicarpus]|uniref:uncharacterized protein LOC130655465 isoform X2 n=1 Tax=Hydractinia symbiolongicarpus TaxID=13093 RepID=UPI00254EF984|nr:uncharacterized protein LOC130655465 isoform X2 [Hydractinia symbiolongicarpus]
MEEVYEVSSSDVVINHEKDFEKVLQDLQIEIENNSFLGKKEPFQGISSVPVPKDVKYFRNERKIAIRNILQVREASPLQNQSVLMKEQLDACMNREYTTKSLPLLLHQHFVTQVKEFLLCIHLHKIRWARFCEHTKEMEAIYPEYQKRMSEITKEYYDALERSKRLSKSREALLLNTDMPNSTIKPEDLVIYTRWLVCHFHSMKKIQSFFKVIQWIPQSHLKVVNFKTEEDIKQLKSISVKRSENSLSSLHISPGNSGDGVKPTFRKHASSLWKYTVQSKIIQKPSSPGLPLLSMKLEDFSSLLDCLLSVFGIDMRCVDIRDSSDEIDMLNLALRKFKQIHYRQSRSQRFETYELLKQDKGASVKGVEPIIYRKESNWLPYIQIKSDIDGSRLSFVTKLEEQSHIDEMLALQSQFLHIESSQEVIYFLREHMKRTEDFLKIYPAFVTSYANDKATGEIWNNIFCSKTSGKGALNYDLEFGTKIFDDKIIKTGHSEFDIHESVLKLGLQTDDIKRHSITSNGAYLSMLMLRHLQIKEYQQMCKDTLNYFRSVERTLTINDVGLLMRENSEEEKFLLPEESKGLGSHQYMHNSPADYAVDSGEKMTRLNNHDDFYTFKDDRILVQDQKGYYVMYDAALRDYKCLEQELLLVCSHFIKRFALVEKSGINDIDLNKKSSRKVDRFRVLLDIWESEILFCQKKRNLLDCYFEVYHHCVSKEERKSLAKIMMTIMKQRPRIDFNEKYFVKAYQYETLLLRSHCDLVKSIIDEHIVDQRQYIQKLYRDGQQKFGLPLKVVPIQSISVNTSRPALKNIFMLEFHPSLAIISSLPDVLRQAYRELIHTHQPDTTTKKVFLELKLIRTVQKCWNEKKNLSLMYSKQVNRDFFSDVFVEDPILVCQVGETMTTVENMRGSRIMRTEEIKKMITIWSNLLEAITYRQRLMTALNETSILLNVYEQHAKNVGVDECNAHLRPVSFDFAKVKPVVNQRPFTLKQLLEDESRMDRFIPTHLSLAIAELDEKHLAAFSFRNREGLVNILQGSNLDKLALALMTQVCEKNLLASTIQQVNGCLNLLRRKNQDAFLNEEEASYDTMIKPSLADVVKQSALLAVQNRKVRVHEKLKQALVSVQAEKTFFRDKMLIEYIHIKEKKGIQTTEDILRVKKHVVSAFCVNLQGRIAQHALRAQILSYIYSLEILLGDFPVTRDAHFMFGCEDDEKNVSDEISIDPDILAKRPQAMLSRDGKLLLNLWYIPHYTEIVQIYAECDDDECERRLTLILKLISSLHDICQYLCGHARSGSSHARMGSHKLDFSGVTADWGGTEGIGAELREIQKQINELDSSLDPEQVAFFLERKRDVMFLEFHIAMSHSVGETFLSSGNKTAYQKVVNGMEMALEVLSNAKRRVYSSFKLDIPEPLEENEERTRQLLPWRSFINRCGSTTGLYNSFYDIAFQMQLPLFDLKPTDRHVVHGEILGMSLLLEDILAAGSPNSLIEAISSSARCHSNARSRPVPNRKSECLTRTYPLSIARTSENFQQGELSMQKTPLQAVEFIYSFLLLWARLESVKHIWACQRLNTLNIDTTKIYSSFSHVFKHEVVYVVYKQMLSVSGNDVNPDHIVVDDNEVIQIPDNVKEYEIKVRQLSRLLELLECNMVQDCTREMSRKHTLVLAERVREDPTLPTDLWKQASIKENFTVQKSHIVEDFVDDINACKDGASVTLDLKHFDKCLTRLATACMQREKILYVSYASFYENLLRLQNQTLYIKEQKIKQLKKINQCNEESTIVKIDCGLADKCYSLLIEVTALRAKIDELTKVVEEKEKILAGSLKEQYKELVENLFYNAFNMKARFEQFQTSLHVDFHQTLTQVRRVAVEKLRNVRVKFGFDNAVDMHSHRLIMAEAFRESNCENKKLSTVINKLKALHTWNKVKDKSKCTEEVLKYQKIAAKATKLSLENSVIHEEKEILLQKEQDALRSILVTLEQECERLRKHLQNEHRMQSQKSHAYLQEAQSLSHLELAKSSNLEKLANELKEKEVELQLLRNANGADRRFSARSTSESKRLLKETMQQVNRERQMKLDAFERADELQKKVNDLELKLVNILSKEKESYHETCFPPVPGGRVSPQKMRPSTQAASILSWKVCPILAGESRPKSFDPSKRRVTPQSRTTNTKKNKSEFSLNKIHINAFP